jgi:D-alanine-D-alanine ligase
MRRALVLHGVERADPPPDEADSVEVAQLVAATLARAGWDAHVAAIGLDLARSAERVRAAKPDLVFNLVDDVGGEGRYLAAAGMILDSLGLAYTGSGTAALALTTDKPAAKRVMRAAGLPTPDWTVRAPVPPGRWIVKPAEADGSVGIGHESVVDARDAPALLARPGRWIAERFVDGREFNVSLLERRGVPLALPIAEMTFDAWPAGAPRIVGYASKWHDEGERAGSPGRTYDHTPQDGKLVERIRAVALDCWRVFGLRGYARVDVRVDEEGEPWILEVNANPCLAPDAGFAAAAQRAGLTLDEVVLTIAEAAFDA